MIILTFIGGYMKKIIIGSMNIKNDKINRLGGLSENGINNSETMGNYVNKMKFDFIGTQEMTYVFIKSLKKYLNKEYQIVGQFRYANNFFKKIVPYNESNSIITNKKILKNLTLKLPWLPNKLSDYKFDKLIGITPRIATIVIEEENNICYINTHLDYKFSNVQKKQLDFIINYITKISDEYNIILTGDFNMELSNPLFSDFVLELNKLKLKRIEIEEYTWDDKIIDHIFIPEKWVVEEKGIMKDNYLTQISDHNGIYAKVVIE
jgi:endonuclease/exonuclease/phosphatase family metal-dependent hydrolase